MSLQTRYDSLLKDMLTLLQQALYRFFTQKQVDLSKFKKYFCSFYKGLTELEEGFHQKSVKFTKSINKLSQLFQKSSTNQSKFSLQPTPSKVVEPSLILSKPRTINNQSSLNIIGQQQQQNYDKQKQKRSGTAEGRRRSQNFVIDFSQGKYRPKTGVSRQNYRYTNQTPAQVNQTINYQSNPNHFRTLNSKQFQDNYQQLKPERKSFYNQLQKNSKAQVVYQNMVKIPKRRSISTHRWSFKINKLF